MRILITSGLTAADVGGPAQYGQNLKNEFQAMGHAVKLISYGPVERLLPVGFRHLWFFFRILPAAIVADHILTLDAFSAGLPTTVAARMARRKVIVRIGGDYLWSAYVNRTREAITLSEFYQITPQLLFKEKIIRASLKSVMQLSDVVAFNTEWQKKIWETQYAVKRAALIRNFIPAKAEGNIPHVKNFLWAGRTIPEKNIAALEEVGRRMREKYPDFTLDIATGEPREKILEKAKNAYALVSAAYTDVCPNFIIEGISFNKPFVMTKETGLDELYPEGGIFFDPLDVEEMESAFEAMLDFRIYNDSVEALKRNPIKHSWKNIAEELIELWKQS